MIATTAMHAAHTHEHYQTLNSNLCDEGAGWLRYAGDVSRLGAEAMHDVVF